MPHASLYHRERGRQELRHFVNCPGDDNVLFKDASKGGHLADAIGMKVSDQSLGSSRTLRLCDPGQLPPRPPPSLSANWVVRTCSVPRILRGRKGEGGCDAQRSPRIIINGQ